MNGGGCGVAYVIIWNPTWQADGTCSETGCRIRRYLSRGKRYGADAEYPGNVDLHRLMRFLGIKEKALPVVNVKQHNLSSYEQLLRGKGGSQ